MRITNRPMRPVLIGVAAAALAIVITSCNRDTSESSADDGGASDPVAIEIGNRQIRLSELQAEVDLLRQRRSPVVANLDSFLDASIDRLAALEEARELGLDRDPELRRQIENLIIGRLRESSLETQINDITISDEDIRAHFEANLAAYSRPAQVRLALLFLSTPSRAGDEVKAATRSRLEEAKTIAANLPPDTRGFGEHAMTFSEEATSRFKGGDIGWLEAGASAYRWPDAVVEAGFALAKPGDLSDIIETDEGFYLLMKLDSRDAVVRSLDGRLRSTLEAQILREKRAAIETSMMEEWKSGHPVTTHPGVLEKLRFADPESEPAAAAPVPANP